MLKMCQSSLVVLGIPAVVCVANVCGDYVSGDVAHGAEKLAGAPEMSFTEVLAQPRVLAEKAEGASALQQLERTRDAHSGRQAHKQVHMVGLHLQLENLHPVLLRDFPQKTLAMAPDHCELERIHCIFGFPYKMECVLPYSVAMGCQSFHFSPSAQKFRIAHANTNTKGGCANYAAHPPLRTSVENREVTSKASERYLVRNSSAA